MFTEEIIVKALGAILSGLVLLVMGRWASKLTRSLDDQLVFNVKITGALTLLEEKLSGHETLDDERHDAVRERMASLERDVAHRSGRA